VAQLFAAGFEAQGLSVWWDADLRSGEAYDEVTEQALAEAKAVVVLWSARSVASRWVRSEATQADRLGALVPVMIEPCKRPIMFELTQTADLAHWSGDQRDPAWLAFIDDVRRFTQRDPAPREEIPAPAPAATPAPVAARRDSERRHLTVLSCQLSYAAAPGELDPEDWQSLSQHRATLRDTIGRLGGHVVGSGESLTAYFGYPVAQEDAAERAVRAGLAVIDTVRDLNQAAGRGVATLTARVGIHAGMVVVAWEAGKDLSVSGEIPAVAARVQAAAAPDSVAISPDVHGLVEGLFAFEPAGDLYRVVAAAPSGPRSRGFAPREQTPFVGRDDEARLLSGRWDSVREGEGQLVLMIGEPGIGKTRLTQEFRNRVGDEPHLWRECGGGPLYANTAFYPILQMVNEGLGLHPDQDGAEQISRLEQAFQRAGMRDPDALPLVAEMLDLPASAYRALEVSPEEKRRRLLAVLAAWIFHLTNNQPVVLVFEDLHWFDPSSLELLRILAEQGATAPLMMLCTARPEFRPAWPTRAHHARLTLNRLSERQTRELVINVIAGSGAFEELANAVLKRTDGVPLFAEELTRLMLERGPRADIRDVPATLLDSLSVRLDRLGRAKEIAQLGSVLGREFSYELLRAVSPVPDEDLQSSLAALADAELIYARGLPPDATYQFKHALILDAAYGSLLKSKRRDLHSRVAATLSESFPRVAEAQPEVLAGHWTEAGEVDKAVAAWSAAGQRAAVRAAHAEAVGHLRRALELVRSRPAGGERSAAELPLLIRLAVSLSAMRGYSAPEVGQVLSEAAELCDALGNVNALFDVQVSICNFRIVAAQRDDGEDAGRRCEEIAARTGEPAQLIQAAQVMGWVLHDKADLAGARERLETLARLYAKHEGWRLSYPTPHDPLVMGLNALAPVLWIMGDASAGERVATQCLAHARSLGRPYNVAASLTHCAHFYVLLGRYDHGLELAEESIAICEANGYATWLCLSQAFKGLAVGHLGDPTQGLELFDAAMDVAVPLGILESHGSRLAEAATLHLRAGDVPGAKAAVEEGITWASRGNRLSLSRLHRRKAEVLMATPGADPADIEASLREALAIAEGWGAPEEARKAREMLAAMGGLDLAAQSD
jgi:tetratricopeptide (TPR) repeat protein